MKWITHQTGAILGALALNLPLAGMTAAAVGAVAPDVIDQKISCLGVTPRARQRVFNQIHRGSSHWFGWWLALFLAPFIQPFPGGELVAGFGAGGLSHAALDMLTPRGVPIFPFSRTHRLALPVCSTGSWGEWLFLGITLLAGFYFLGPETLNRVRYALSQLS